MRPKEEKKFLLKRLEQEDEADDTQRRSESYLLEMLHQSGPLGYRQGELIKSGQ